MSKSGPLVLVTGTSGFIGRHLCRHLLEKGYRVRGTYRGCLANSSLSAVEWICTGDIGPDTDWTNALISVDYVVHLAALAHQIGRRSEGRVEDFMRVNADGTRRLVEQMVAHPYIRRFLFLSSLGVMRAFSDSPITMSTPCIPDTDYGMSKLVAEQHIQNVLGSTSIEWCIIRCPLVYGPGNPGNMERLFKLIRKRVPLPFGSIRNLRSFIFVGNLVDLIEKCLTHPRASSQVFLASDRDDLSTPDLIRRIARHSGWSVILFPFPIPVLKSIGYMGDLIERFTNRSIGIDNYSIERLTRSLYVDVSSLDVIGWYPPYSVDEGLYLTLEGSNC